MYHGVGIVSLLCSEVNSGKSVDWVICRIIDSHKTWHYIIRLVRLEANLLANPFCTFTSNSLLSKFIAQLYFKLRTAKATFTAKTWDIKLTLLLWGLICSEGWRGKNET